MPINDFIIVATSRLSATKNKNILTVWTYENNIEIRIMPDEPKTFSKLTDYDDIFTDRLKKIYLNISNIA